MNNLPPDVTMRDIDPPTMTCPQCGGRGYQLKWEDGDAEMVKCARCGGGGEVNKTADGE